MNAVYVIIAGVAGFACGFAFFRALAANVALYVSGRAKGRAIAVHVLRLAGVGAAFFAAAQFGAAPLLAALVGFLIARAVTTRKKKEETA